MSQLYIVDYLGSQGWNTPNPQIFMGLKNGSLEQLVRSKTSFNPDTVFHHMLQALDYLATQGLIHRDVKPENILYILEQDNKHLFQLGDFGFSNYANMATTFAGTPKFMAPEMFLKGSGRQTHKVDIWSLYVTMIWTLDIGGFRDASERFRSIGECQDAVLLIASEIRTLKCIAPMARTDPQKRASAAQLLVELFNGNGLSTPRNMVPILVADTATAESKAPATQEHLQDSEHLDASTRRFRFRKTRRYPLARRDTLIPPMVPNRAGQALGRRFSGITKLRQPGFTRTNHSGIRRQLGEGVGGEYSGSTNQTDR